MNVAEEKKEFANTASVKKCTEYTPMKIKQTS